MPWLDWLSLFLRWFHVVAGIAWIGASFYFIWLDNNLKTPPQWKKDRGIKGDLWAVHGGGFYEVAKYSYGPQTIPEPLHWFKWEAYSTWISGVLLLILVYYFGASAYLIDPAVKSMSVAQAVGSGIGMIAVGWLMYELACRSPLGQYPRLFGIALVILLSVASWLTTQWFSGRGAYIHVGALIGTIMAANVFVKIIPAQKLMVNAVANKLPIDPRWGEQAKLRSVHNNYLTLPLLFIMISNHYPMTYQHSMNWLVLILIMLLSAWIRHYFNLKHTGQHKPSVLVSGMIGLALVAAWVSYVPAKTDGDTVTAVISEPLTAKTELDQQVQVLISEHCVSCHSATPTDAMFSTAPLGFKLDTWQQISDKAAQISHRTAGTKDMPFLNKSGMTMEERNLIAHWYQKRLTN